jgi:hypothetical protein
MASKGRKPDPNARLPGENYFAHQSRLARQGQEARDREQPLVTAEAEQHGDYQTDFVTHVETNTKAHTKINRGGSPVERWERDKKLDMNQLAAIGLCLRLWRLASINPKVVASYGERVLSGGNWEGRAHDEIEAREDLHRIMGYFPGPLKSYWDVYENVCRHGIAAGVAGAALNHGTRSAEVRSHQIVCFVADTICGKEGL